MPCSEREYPIREADPAGSVTHPKPWHHHRAVRAAECSEQTFAVRAGSADPSDDGLL